MTETTMKHDDVLDEQTLQLLGDAPATLETSPENMKNLRDAVMHRVDDDISDKAPAFLTIRNDDGEWTEIAPKLKRKVLYENPETGATTYFLKAEPGVEAPSHNHEFDEHCLVLEGEVTFEGGLHLKAGDYHFAAAGTEHGMAYTDVGVLVFIQDVPRGAPAPF